MNEMERIQRGLEEFLQQELSNEAAGTQENARGTDPLFFTIGEEEKPEKEIDVIGMSTRQPARRRTYEEDWDSREPRRQAARPQGTAPKNAQDKKREPAKRAVQSDRREPAKRTVREAAKAPKKKSRLKRFLAAVLIILVLLAVGLYYVVGRVYDKMNYHEIESLTAAPMQEDGVVNILLIGNDSRENGEDGRSDAMILLSVSNKTKKIYMTSLLRDIYVDIPGHDGNRLNAAYSFGGAELLMETVEQNLGITVNRYVLVNFEAFANLVDAVGGVDLELSSAEIELVNGYLWEYNVLTERPEGTDYMDTTVEGLVHLNGPQALAYSRNRYIGTDFGRTERQRKVLAEVIHGLPKAALTNPKELVDGLMPNLTTNLTQGECYRLSLMAPKLLTYDIEQGNIPQEGTYSNATIRGMAVLEVDFEANKEYLRRMLFEPEDTLRNSLFLPVFVTMSVCGMDAVESVLPIRKRKGE